MLLHNFEKEVQSDVTKILAGLWQDVLHKSCRERSLGVSNKSKILNKPHVTFALTTVKKSGCHFPQSYNWQDDFRGQFDPAHSMTWTGWAAEC